MGDPPLGLKLAPEAAWRFIDASVYAEYEVKYTTTAVKITQETITTQWFEDSNGNPSDVGQRVQTNLIDVQRSTSMSINQLGIVGATRLPVGANIVPSVCIINNMNGC